MTSKEERIRDWRGQFLTAKRAEQERGRRKEVARVFPKFTPEMQVHWDRDIAPNEPLWAPECWPHIDERGCVTMGWYYERERVNGITSVAQVWVDYVSNPVPHWRRVGHFPDEVQLGWYCDPQLLTGIERSPNNYLTGTSYRIL